MSTIDSRPGPDWVGHPTQSSLSAWMRGELPAEESAQIEQHLEACDDCAERVGAIAPTNDPFLRRLRNANGFAESIPAAPGPMADANLLFGALALQAGLINAQQLADACVLWAARGGVPLADLLVEQEWIDHEAQASIAGLLAARVRKAPRSPAAETLSGRERVANDFGDTLVPATTPDDRLRLKKLHSQGGIGQVWLAEDTLLGREVAMKELLPELRGSRTHRERFFREARVGAQLSHPGTAPVYEYREEGGRCYYTMKFYRGRTFSEVIEDAHAKDQEGSDGSLSSFERLFPLLEQFLSICDTIAYAHSQGIVHRDLKGENVLLGEFGEVTVIDWGLAKSIVAGEGAVSPSHESDPDQKTLEGERLGTPGYMAPEQARGDLAAIDQRTDVYGLAAVLYEVLTTRPPFRGQTANEVMHHVEVSPPAPPSLSHAETPAELEAICLRGLEKRKEDRYRSAADLRDAVRGWLALQVHQQQESDRQAKFFALSQDLFIALDERGFIKQVNPAYSRFFGFGPAEKTGKHYADRIHPDDIPRAKQMFKQVQRGISQKDTVIRIADSEDVFRPVSWTVTHIPGEPMMYAVGRPLDEENERRRATESRARFFSLSPDLFVISDEKGHAGQINEAWEHVLGWTAEDVVGTPFSHFVHPDDVAQASRAGRRALLREAVVNLETRVRRRDGAYRTIAWTICRVPGDRINYAIGRDITESKETEERLRALLEKRETL